MSGWIWCHEIKTVNTEKGEGFAWRDEKLNFDAVELGICGTSTWRCPKGHCRVWGNSGTVSRRCHWIQTRGTVLRTVAVLFRAWYHSLDQKDHFSRHQGMDRNSSILCYSFSGPFYPLELSLLIILICFCFNCFSGSLFIPGWNLQIPRGYLAMLVPTEGCWFDRTLPTLSPGDQYPFSAQCPQQTSPSRCYQTYLSPLSLPRRRLSNMEPRIWIFFEIFFPFIF